ncbi:MAG: DUF975 family protein [Lawsonibacter sp.]
MEIDRKELKRRSREAMGLTRPRFWIVTLIYFLMTVGVSDLLSLLPFPSDSEPGFSTLAFFATIFLLLYKVVVDFGFHLWSLWTSRKLNPDLGSLIQGFSVAGRVILMKLIILARIMLWSLGICFVALLPLWGMDSLSSFPLLLFMVIGLLYAVVWVLMLRYALAPYLLADRPDDGAGAAVRRSVALMKGWKWELFRLELSFLGWILLSVLLSALAFALSLWHAGVFHALAAFSFEEVPELVAGYSIWQSGLPVDLFPLTSDQIDFYSLYATVSDSMWTALLTDLIALPLTVWLTPYRSVARAGFYDARLQLQRENTDPLPL